MMRRIVAGALLLAALAIPAPAPAWIAQKQTMAISGTVFIVSSNTIFVAANNTTFIVR